MGVKGNFSLLYTGKDHQWMLKLLKFVGKLDIHSYDVKELSQFYQSEEGGKYFYNEEFWGSLLYLSDQTEIKNNGISRHYDPLI